MLDLNEVRQEFAQHLAQAPTARWRMDSALAHVATMAYAAGAADATGADARPHAVCIDHATSTLTITSNLANWQRDTLNRFAAEVYHGFIQHARHRDALYEITRQLIRLADQDPANPIGNVLHHCIDRNTLNRVISEIEADTGRTQARLAAA